MAIFFQPEKWLNSNFWPEIAIKAVWTFLRSDPLVIGPFRDMPFLFFGHFGPKPIKINEKIERKKKNE